MFVWMTDKFMSGWGGACGRVAKYVIECDNLVQAEAIAKAAEARSEMRSVNYGAKCPYFSESRYQVTQRNVRELSGPWLKHMPQSELSSLRCEVGQ